MLYHYTSISSLVQILENRNLMFNNLTKCDDLDEADSKDLGRIGKYVFVSSWTRESEESIPMWSQYSGQMSGVRIGMREYPFVLREDNEGGNSAPFYTYLNNAQYYIENKMRFTEKQPILIDVEYVEDDEKIYPKVLFEGREGDIERYAKGEPSSLSFSFDLIGKYKRTCWEFQHECRYRVFGSPMGIKELEGLDDKALMQKHREIVRRYTDESYIPGYQALFVDLDEDAINNMEIVFGPRMNASEKLLLTEFLKSRGLSDNYRNSSLRIQ